MTRRLIQCPRCRLLFGMDVDPVAIVKPDPVVYTDEERHPPDAGPSWHRHLEGATVRWCNNPKCGFMTMVFLYDPLAQGYMTIYGTDGRPWLEG